MTETDHTIGRLLAESEISQRQREELFRLVREIRKEMVTQEEFKDIEASLLDYKVTKAKIYGMIVAVSALAAGIWELGRSLL